MAPNFEHHPAATLPMTAVDGVEMTVVAGHAFGERSPVHVFSDTLYVSLVFDAGAQVRLPAEHGVCESAPGEFPPAAATHYARLCTKEPNLMHCR